MEFCDFYMNLGPEFFLNMTPLISRRFFDKIGRNSKFKKELCHSAQLAETSRMNTITCGFLSRAHGRTKLIDLRFIGYGLNPTSNLKLPKLHENFCITQSGPLKHFAVIFWPGVL